MGWTAAHRHARPCSRARGSRGYHAWLSPRSCCIALCSTYGWTRLSMPAGTEFSGLRALAPVPALLSAALFGATFTAWKFEWAVGFLVGLLLQACAACATSLVPAIFAHD